MQHIEICDNGPTYHINNKLGFAVVIHNELRYLQSMTKIFYLGAF